MVKMAFEKICTGRSPGMEVGITVLTIFLLSNGAGAATLTVNAGGGADDHIKIQDAINSAAPGDTILVYSGTYYENIIVNKQLILKGMNSDRGKPVVNSLGEGISIELLANGTTLEGFKVITSRSLGGIRVWSSNNTIADNDVSNTSTGIWVGSNIWVASNNNTIADNKVSNTSTGIRVGSSNNTIANNIVSAEYEGITITCYSFNNTITSNTVHNSRGTGLNLGCGTSGGGEYDDLYYLSAFPKNNILRSNSMYGNDLNFGFIIRGINDSEFDNDIDKSNLVDGKPIYILKEVSNKVLDSSSNAGTVYCIKCNNITIKDLSFKNNGDSIFLYKTNNSTIENNNISNRIRLFFSSNNSIIGNTVRDNYFAAISFKYSNFNLIRDNNIRNSDRGIELYFSGNNTIYHNNLINNTWRSLDYVYPDCYSDYISTNLWDFGHTSGGNYWSDYGYLFSWNKIPADHYETETLIRFLQQDYGVDWIRNAYSDFIQKSADGIITISEPEGSNSLSLELNKEQKRIILKINNIKKAEFIWKIENGNINIYYGGMDANNDGIGETPYNISGPGAKDWYPFMKVDGWLSVSEVNRTPVFKTQGGPVAGDPRVYSGECAPSMDENFSNYEIVEKYDMHIYKDKVTSYRFTHAKNPILFVNTTGNVSTNLITAMVEILKGTSTLVTAAPPGIVYKNVNVWVGTKGFAISNNIKEALIRFRVESSWISSNKVSTSDIKLLRWDKSQWVPLETSEKNKDSTYTYFEAKTNALSPLAISAVVTPSGKPASVVPVAGVQSAVTPPGKATQPKGTPGFEIAVAIGAMGAIYILYRNRR